MATSTDRAQEIQKLYELIKDIDYGMFTTVDDDGSLHSYPMSKSGEINDEATLWFFTYAGSHKVAEIEHHEQVNVSFSSPQQQQYVSISGTSQLVKDRNKMRELWKPELQTWFPKGLDEPDIALIEVNINQVNYWDSVSSFKPQIISF
ncbi:pyridoxamine 5'-phosphate oxidase family protein [Nostoc sp. UCD121]|uniref:pyridoxamine 5'-phosphate oxidase family protein n=1 Tax=unclassified Nostoc TaxID=2593658 RepID=UPI00162491A4|nr:MULTISPECIES: pyridoxamine 5'-phosphate oxidase family protein [unclassified Nostoc]MBC1223065.1 pyridoxamine 5'-phosphate oxidase family protein [Nostoc sp. UCD120]MBC1274863.1 pyridoxamine 5'-phosphate oxidase family protein [Nostoc sp. UCD121]MBC1297721.1 pyridoxamine 5'-phosphate oxidase family protein [Nostoc sp. UCD122]